MMLRRFMILAALAIAGACKESRDNAPDTARITSDTRAPGVQRSGLKVPDTVPSTASSTPDESTPPGRIALTPPATVPATLTEWERFDYSTNAVPASSLASMPLDEVQRIRAIIFGKHGRVFQDDTLQHWLASRAWYHADTSFTNTRLTSGERANLEVVREAEAAKHPHIESGDMRFYQNRVITTAMLGTHSPQDWEVIEAEVLANHGYVFAADDDDYDDRENRRLSSNALQQYFDERYWYERKGRFSASELSPIERQNLDTIALAIMKQNHRSASPGVMKLFTTTPLTDAMLSNVNLAELRVMRNEIYALHGRPFETPWLRDYFRAQPWYTPRKDYSDSDLSAVEKANIALIARREDELHQSLSTRLLDVADVRGLRFDDARRLRNEIFARHGRRFKDPALQHYFASFSWYHPNDAFRESQLSSVERQNAALISQYEHGKFTEG